MRNIKVFISAVVLTLMVNSCGFTGVEPGQPVDLVNPYVGNISHLLVPTYPTVHLPNSMIRVFPDKGNYTGVLLHGLPVVVTSHRGNSDFVISPFQGNAEDIRPVISYSYDLEKITPYSYTVYLDEQQTEVKFAPSHQSALYEINFRPDNATRLIINSREGELRWDGKAVRGFRSLANGTRVFIYLETEASPLSTAVINDGILLEGVTEDAGINACIVLNFDDTVSDLRVRYGISFIDEEQAKRNLEREISNYEIVPLWEEGRKLWNEKLGKTTVEGGSEDDRIMFYTSVYRTYERPVNISEDGRYFSATDGQVHDDNGVPYYTDDWIWDTFRATHPLRVLTEPEMEENILNSFIRMAEQSDHFWMPTFPGVTGDTHAMNGNHGVATILDAWRKGLRGFDLERGYLASRGAITEKSMLPWTRVPATPLDEFYKENGFFPALHGDETETVPEVHPFEKRQAVAITQGAAYDRWCLSQIARELGRTDEYQEFLKDSYDYRNLFNEETGFFHPRDDEGDFIEPFDYRFSGGMGARDYYDENNGWVYRWNVQHNVADLINLMGGRENFIKNLDATFAEPLGRSKYEFYSQLPDHTGNVGQFSMGNEPSFHIPYFYNYAGQPWSTQKSIRKLLESWFRNDLMGIPGDEDGGGMSAFVAFSMMGFYPVTPGLPVYNIGSPVFSEATIIMEGGNEFMIVARNYHKDNKYIQSAKLNGVNWNKPWFSHDDIKDGAVLELVMGSKANRSWGSDPGAAPPSAEDVQ